MGKVVRLPKRSLNWRVIAAGMLTLYFFFPLYVWVLLYIKLTCKLNLIASKKPF